MQSRKRQLNAGSPLYWVLLFESAWVDVDYRPYVSYLPKSQFEHMLDPDLVPALRALWWCLHLPTGVFQTCDLSASSLVASEDFDQAHRIALVPTNLAGEFLRSRLHLDVALIIAPDAFGSSAVALAGEVRAPLGAVPYSQLDQYLLDDIWIEIATRNSRGGDRFVAPALAEFGTESSVEQLSGLYRELQLAPIGVRPVNRARNHRDVITEHLTTSGYLRTIAKMESSGCSADEFGNRFDDTARATRPSVHLAIGSAGASSIVRRLAASKDNHPPSSASAASVTDERSAIGILVAHQAIKFSGLGMILPDVPPRAFELLQNLEQASGARRPNPHKVHTVLSEIGTSLGASLSSEQRRAIRHGRSLVAFTDFPWGLAILPGDSAPVSSIIPVSYRPLTPLTRQLQIQVGAQPHYYWGNGFSVLIAECLDEKDPARKRSEMLWRRQVELLQKQGKGKVRCRFEVVASLAQLHRLLDEESFDALVVTTHGVRSGQAAQLQIGRDVVLDLGHPLPPFVALCACEIWPRGRGAVSVADLALRWGAVAVLGTLVPVRVDHNALTVMRIFLPIAECVNRSMPHFTLADAISRALASNAVNDMFHGTTRMFEWSRSPMSTGGGTPLEEFMLRRSRGRLRPSSIYSDSEDVLKEIADDCGAKISDYVRKILGDRAYIPESLFYAMIGSPESILLQPRSDAEATLRAAEA